MHLAKDEEGNYYISTSGSKIAIVDENGGSAGIEWTDTWGGNIKTYSTPYAIEGVTNGDSTVDYYRLLIKTKDVYF